jgi:hypothetical protein
MTIDFSPWKLTLPVDVDGGYDGAPREIKPITDNFEYPPYFDRVVDGVIFSAPVDGAHTSGSLRSRSELRELIKGTEAAWNPTTYKYNKLVGTAQMLELPSKLDNSGFWSVVIGQIHGKDNELCRLNYGTDGSLYYYNDKSGSAGKELKFILKDPVGKPSIIKLGEEFTYYIVVEAGKLKVSALHNGVKYSASEVISSYFKKDKLYYKAGVYPQCSNRAGDSKQGKGRATAKFTDIRVVHTQ